MQPPSRILATSLSRIATSSPRSLHRTTPLNPALQGGTNSGVTPNASQNSRRVLAVRLDLSSAAAPRLASSTARAAAPSTAALKAEPVMAGRFRNARIAAISGLLQVNLPTLFPTGVHR